MSAMKTEQLSNEMSNVKSNVLYEFVFAPREKTLHLLFWNYFLLGAIVPSDAISLILQLLFGFATTIGNAYRDDIQ